MATRTINTILNLKDQASANLKKISGGTADVSRQAKKAQNDVQKFGKSAAASFSSMARGVGLAALAYVGFSSAKQFLTDAMTSAKESEKVMAQLGAVIASTGGVSGMTATSVSALTDKLNLHTIISKASILEGENLLLTFTKIGKDVFPEASQAILDMSQALGKDTSSSAVMLGKALNDPISGMTALKKAGVSFTEQQKKQIETMQKSGNLAGAQKLILKELATEFGGSAEAQTKTAAGIEILVEKQLAALKKQTGQALLPLYTDLLKIGIGAMPAVTAGFVKIIEGVKTFSVFAKTNIIPTVKTVFEKSAELYDFIKDNWSFIAPMIWGIAAAMGAWKAITAGMFIYKGIMAGIQAGTVGATIAQWGLNAAVLANPMTWIVVGIAAAIGLLVATGIYMYKHWDFIGGKMHSTWVGIKNSFADGVNYCIDLINALIVGLNNLPGVHINLIGHMGYSVVNGRGSQSRGLTPDIKGPSKVEAPKAEPPKPFSYPTTPGGGVFGGSLYANGGIANRPSIFGEAGKEIAIPLKGNARSQQLLQTADSMINGNSKGKGIHIYIDTFIGTDEFIETIGEKINRKLNLQLLNMA
jgi:hypothetical protein